MTRIAGLRASPAVHGPPGRRQDGAPAFLDRRSSRETASASIHSLAAAERRGFCAHRRLARHGTPCVENQIVGAYSVGTVATSCSTHRRDTSSITAACTRLSSKPCKLDARVGAPGHVAHVGVARGFHDWKTLYVNTGTGGASNRMRRLTNGRHEAEGLLLNSRRLLHVAPGDQGQRGGPHLLRPTVPLLQIQDNADQKENTHWCAAPALFDRTQGPKNADKCACFGLALKAAHR